MADLKSLGGIEKILCLSLIIVMKNKDLLQFIKEDCWPV